MTVRRSRAVLAIHAGIIVLLLGLQFVLPPFHHAMLARIMVLAAFATGYNVLLGYTGLMSLGHAMFFAAGVYGAGLTVYYLGLGAVEAVLIGALAGATLSAAVGVLALRTTGVAFFMVTMMFAQAFYLATLFFNRITGGDQGLILTGRLRPVQIGDAELAFADAAVKYNVALGAFVLCFLFGLWLIRSPAGRVLVAIRENEERTRMLGYNTFKYKLLALIISGGMSGIAGATYTLLFSYVGSTFASVLYSIFPLLWALLGGIGTTIGPLVGTALMTYLVDVTSGITTGYLIVVGAALVVLIMRFPSGVVGGIRARWLRWLP